MGPEILLLILFGLLLLGVFAGFPVAFVMVGSGVLVGVYSRGMPFFHNVLLRVYGVMDNYVLVAIPLFVFMGVMLTESGIAERLFSAFHYLLGGLRGGLAVTTVAICTLMAAATGIVGASVVSMGLFALPAMINRGYDKALSSGSVCAGGTLGILIPPSVMLVVYGPMAGISVGQLFMGAVIPGLLLSGLYIVYILIRCFISPELGPPMNKKERMEIGIKAKLWMITTSLLPTLFVILAVLGSIFFGLATPTAAAASGALAAMLLAFAYGRLNIKVLHNSMISSLKITAMIMWTVIGAFIFTGAFMTIGGSFMIQNFLMTISLGPIELILVMGIAFLILGFVMEWVGIIPILVPIFTPLLLYMKINPLWAAIVFCMIMQTSFLTPPMAPTLFYLKGVAPPEVSFGEHIIIGIIPFLVIQLVGVIMVILFPKLVTWLPSMMY